MRRAAVAVLVLASVLGGTEQPAGAAATTVVSGVAVFSSGMTITPNLLLSSNSHVPVTMTETQQGVFTAGGDVEVANIACTFTGVAIESYVGASYGSLIGSCSGTGLTGRYVWKTCSRTYTRLAQLLEMTDSCWLQVATSRVIVTAPVTTIAHLPPPPGDRYYYTGTLVGWDSPN